MTIIAKTKEKLIAAIHSSNWGGESCHGTSSWCTAAADAILQSPDLRVTLVEPRFCVSEPGLKPVVVRRDEGIDEEIAIFRGHSVGRQLAKEYADWLNSKEPK